MKKSFSAASISVMAAARALALEVAPAAAARRLQEMQGLLPDLKGRAPAKDERGFSVVDVLARGRPSPELALAISALAQIGVGLDEAPRPSELPPLHAACFLGNRPAVEALVRGGANLQKRAKSLACNVNGGTAMHAVAAGFRGRNPQDYVAIVQLLLNSGVSLEDTDAQGNKPIDVAVRCFAGSGLDRTLVDVLFEFGVHTIGGSERAVHAAQLADAVSRRENNPEFAAKAQSSEYRAAAQDAQKARRDGDAAQGPARPAPFKRRSL